MRPVRHARSRAPTAKEKKREETKARLLEAARRLFGEHGYEEVSVTEIAREAGVTHSMINVYFGGKPGLLYEIVRAGNEAQYAQTLEIAKRQETALERLSDVLLLWARADASEPGLLSVMQAYSWAWPPETEEENAKDRARFKTILADLVEEGVKGGEFRASLDPRLSATALFAIYTWGLRPAVFRDATPEECHQLVMRQVRQLLLSDQSYLRPTDR